MWKLPLRTENTQSEGSDYCIGLKEGNDMCIFHLSCVFYIRDQIDYPFRGQITV